MTYDRVYRLNDPSGWKGRRCRIVLGAPCRRDWLAKGIMNTGEATVAVEFDNGERAAVAQQSVVLLTSRLGRQAIRAAKDGLTRAQRSAKLQREWRERQKAKAAHAT